MSKRLPTTFAPVKHARPDHVNPLRELLVCLPLLKVSRDGGLDLGGSPPELVLQLADHAEHTVRAFNLGLAAMGNLWALASAEVEDGTLPIDCVESFGWLLSILSDCSAALLVFAAECRRTPGVQALAASGRES